MLVRIPPKYSVAEVVGYLKGKSAIAVARQFGGRKRNFNGEQFLLDDRDQDLGLRLTGKEVRRLSGV
jgi:REP element-mobilizing transposase RayT